MKRFRTLRKTTFEFFFGPTNRAVPPVFIRDAINYKRIMTTVVISLLPLLIFSIYNIGLQINLLIAKGLILESWHKIWPYHDASSFIDNFSLGLLYFAPLYLVVNVVGGFWEVLFASIRNHEINEGFFVTGFIFPMILPFNIPLWQAAVAISFGIVIGKEIFGGTGYNFLNPAMLSRAFLYLNYPLHINSSLSNLGIVNSGATVLSTFKSEHILNASPFDLFFGFIPGAIGETSKLFILLGAIILLLTKMISWQILFGTVLGVICSSFYSPLPAYYHFLLGGLAFATVFMATDPVTSPQLKTSKFIYGFIFGGLTIFFRTTNQIFIDGVTFALLLSNILAPLLDHVFIYFYRRDTH
jgi:Na+-transporting NADH:ubiquinone oxidoreductase subunit B